MPQYKLYATALISITTPSENIVALDKLRSRYGDLERDKHGSYWTVDEDEVLQFLPAGTTIDIIRKNEE